MHQTCTVTQISLKLLHFIFLQWYTSRTSKSTCDQETSDVCWRSQNRTRRSCPQFFLQKQVQITSLVHRHPVYSKAKYSGFTKVSRFEYSDTLTVYTTAVWRQIFAGLSNQGGGLWRVLWGWPPGIFFKIYCASISFSITGKEESRIS
jgi:hypothetical protein